MKYSTTILIIFSFCASFAQNKSVAIYDNDYIKLIDNSKFAGKDTLVTNTYENGKIHSKGRYALNNEGKVSYIKVGRWIQYYRNGNVESEGSYEISSYLNCGPGGLQREFYNYKIGIWKYFSSENTVDATGNYSTFITHIETQCEGGDDLFFMKTDDKWSFPNGQTNDLKERINYSTTYDGYNEFVYFLKENNTVGRK